MEGENFKMNRICDGNQKFTGKMVQVTDHNMMKTVLQVQYPDGTTKPEIYHQNTPMLVIGNIIIGERYVEPQGHSKITNQTNGDVCEIEFKGRGGWSTKE